MEPAKSVISALGGPSAVARICGCHRTRVSNWVRPKDKGGTGGRIPQNHLRPILDALRARGIEWSAETLLPVAVNAPPPDCEKGPPTKR